MNKFYKYKKILLNIFEDLQFENHMMIIVIFNFTFKNKFV